MQGISFSDHVLLIVLENGLLAGVVVLLGFVLNRSLERFKSGLSWSAELLKLRMTLALKLLEEMRELSDAHSLNTGLRLAGHGQQVDVPGFLKLVKNLESSMAEAKLLFPDPVPQAIDRARGIALEWLTDWPSAEGVSADAMGTWRAARQKSLNAAVEEFRDSLRRCFPATTQAGTTNR